MEQEKWSNGTIVAFDPASNTGMIRPFDGGEVFFQLSDFISTSKAPPMPRIGQQVVFRSEITKLGWQAREITLLDLYAKA